ncbi:hypothetical protein EJ02DRAFT_503611 [Clathrospora elynae]|uniref:Uncharacterized protein n=1 Tax=Clathrospora elynae TaxID=706981 RepID=A0A6A5SNL6_9PLEO|nr:hypothetical protein EJ02DRAFT_503611 [Clathrospora elynae]
MTSWPTDNDKEPSMNQRVGTAELCTQDRPVTVPPLFCTAQVPRSSDAGTSKKRKISSSSEKRRGDSAGDALHGEGRPVVAEVSEKRSSKDSRKKRRSEESGSPRSPRRDKEREEHRPRSQQHHEDAHRSHDQYRPLLHVQVPEIYNRSVNPGSVNSSQEALLNPRPHRSQHTRRRHPKQTSQSTLRGRGAKRDPPRHTKSKKNIRPEPSRGWSLFAPSPPKTPKREHRNYQTLDSSPRSHRSSRHHRSTTNSQATPESSHRHHRSTTASQASPESSRSQTRHHRSRQQEPSAPSTRQARSQTPNTAARRLPDRRFAVLAATNQALEEVRQEAFAQPSPPPRRERLRRYEGVSIPTSQIPFNWDCVSSSQTSAGNGNGNRVGSGEASCSRQGRSRR